MSAFKSSNDLSDLSPKSNQIYDLTLKSNLNFDNTPGLSPNPEFGLAANTPNNNIIIDSGASEHYSPNKDWFINYKATNKSIIIANGQRIAIKGIGDIPIIANHRELIISKVNYIPEIKTTLLSSRELAKKGWEVLFKGNTARLLLASLNISLIAPWDYNAYYLNFKINSKVINLGQLELSNSNNTKSDNTNSNNTNSNILELYHKRLNHVSKDNLIKTLNQIKSVDLSLKLLNLN